jgi:hypothetical protein
VGVVVSAARDSAGHGNTLTGLHSSRILPHDFASSGLAPLSLPSKACTCACECVTENDRNQRERTSS